MPSLPKHLTCDRFASDYPEPGSMKVKKPDNRLTLTEFLGCLVRISFLRANPRHGNMDAYGKVTTIELPGCLRRMLDDNVLPNAKRDTTHLLRQQMATDANVQAVFGEYRQTLLRYYEAMRSVQLANTKERVFGLELFLAFVKGELLWKRGRVVKNDNPDAGQASGLGTNAIVGECARDNFTTVDVGGVGVAIASSSASMNFYQSRTAASQYLLRFKLPR